MLNVNLFVVKANVKFPHSPLVVETPLSETEKHGCNKLL